jgi:hypothetical protein
LLKILSVGDISGEFFVPAYQRGYRWGELEVRQLLSDIRESDGGTYYLQPVVVKGRDDGSWELVDGQQRLTTLYLIFQYLKRTHLPSAAANYSITYETREGSKAYLDRLNETDSSNNIDFFHMFRAYRCIEAWFAIFGHRTTHEATRMYGYLFDNVKVLWYVAPLEVDSTDLFTRLNIGRIPLTDAELVKALLLSHGQPGLGQTDRAVEVAAHWDLIERDLRVPEVWAFVTGEVKEQPTHISLLLDTLAGGPRGRERHLFQTFEALRGQIEDDPQEFWRDVVNLHSLVLGWYDDRALFHKVGYLIAVGRTFDELRPERMPKILADVGRLIRNGDLDGVETLNQAQANDEKLKAVFLAAHPELRHAVFALEDHELLRGSLGAFELDPATFEARASVFVRLMSEPDLWSELLAALLAVGEYQRRRTNSRPFLFGTSSKRHDSAWRELLTGPPRDGLQPTRQTLAAFLDRVAASPAPPLVDVMKAITKEYLASREAEARLDWRYYMVRYPSMREKGSSTYFAERIDDAEQASMGYSLCMLNAGGRALNGYYRDPYLLAIWRELDTTPAVEDKWFTGYESEPRRLPLAQSGATIRCIPAGFELSTPPLVTDAKRFAAVCEEVGVTANNLVTVSQVEVDGKRVDTVDRIQIGANILRRLIAAGL